MTRLILLLSSLFLLLAGTLVLGGSASAGLLLNGGEAGAVVVADRGSGTLSVVDVATDQLVQTILLPGTVTPEPMYVVYVKKNHRIFVGDRANNQVIALDADDLSVVGTVAAGSGVFHMWAHKKNPQLWVNNDVDNTITVIDPDALTVIATVPLPADLVAAGGKAHDVILDKDSAYVTMVALAGPSDVVVKYDRSSFEVVATTEVGKDPHVMLTGNEDVLYVASQNANQVVLLARADLSTISTIDVPGAHGVWIPKSGDVLYVTNLPGGGVDGIYTVDLRTRTLLGTGVDSPNPTPHNVVANRNGTKLYVTHSGATANQLSIYTISRSAPLPVAAGVVTVGLNPFGLAYIPR